MSWLCTASTDEAEISSSVFWDTLSQSVQEGTFWADEIKNLKGDPAKRLNLALESLPLPHAFKEAAIALRAIIREQRKSGKQTKDELNFLYWLAASDSFCLEYAPRLKQPGFNVMQSSPGDVVKRFAFRYSQLGYRKLRLLNKTDIKWLVELHGEPKKHTTLNAMFRSTWDKYEEMLITQETYGRSGFLEDLLREAERQRVRPVPGDPEDLPPPVVVHQSPPELPRIVVPQEVADLPVVTKRPWWKFWG